MGKEVKSVTIDLEIPIRAPREKVWAALVNDIDLWWRKDFLLTPAKKFILEPWIGGKMYEDAGDGTGAVWYQVQAIMPNDSLFLTGFLFAGCGGPGTTLLQLKLDQQGAETVLKVSDFIVGDINDETQNNVSSGWMMLFAEGLKPYAEGM